MAQYIYTMNRVSKLVPPKREILKDISLSFFPGAKIGVLGLNGSGKSTLLKIMAGVDKDFSGEARAAAGTKIGYLEQEPHLDPAKNVRGNVEDGVRECLDAMARLDEVFGEYAMEDADFDKLAAEQEKLESIIQAWDGHNLDNQLEQAADALRLPAWDADVNTLSGGERRRVEIARALAGQPVTRRGFTALALVHGVHPQHFAGGCIERHDRPARAADRDRAGRAPVDLRALARGVSERQIRGLTRGPHRARHGPKVRAGHGGTGQGSPGDLRLDQEPRPGRGRRLHGVRAAAAAPAAQYG